MKSIKLPKHFGFTDDHDMLRQTARRFLTDKCPLQKVQKRSSADGLDMGLWRELAGLGWTGILIGDKYGGAGLDVLSMALVLEEAGRVLLPAPLLTTVLAGLTIDGVGDEGQKQSLLPGIASGELIATVAWGEEDNAWDPTRVSARAAAADGGYVLTGLKTQVPWGLHSDVVVAPFRIGEVINLFAVDLKTPGLEITPQVVVDGTRPSARLCFNDVKVPPTAKLPGGGATQWRHTFQCGYTLLAAESTGAAQAILSKTRDYALERIQFDRPIGSFQAVKHPLVNVLIAVERARSHALGAAATLEVAPEQCEVAARMAKSSADDALSLAADRGVQLHGGYGFTIDCDAHLFMKRAIWSAATLGDPHHHRRHLAEFLLG